MTNDELVTAVTDELKYDPKLDSEEVAIAAADGKVTLRGTVSSFREKREASRAAERVYGTTSVENNLEVRPRLDTSRTDAELRADVLQALMLDSTVPATVEAHVWDGHVTLTGEANWNFQRAEAERVAGNIAGVLDVSDEIALMGPEPKGESVESDIKEAFKRNAKLDAKEITVETSDHTVTLKGTVPSWVEHDEAIAAAWAAPGVQKVRDRLVVAY